MCIRDRAKAGVLVGFCGGGGTPLFAATEMDIDIAWLQPQSEYRPTEYLQHWVRFWFDDALRLQAAREVQLTRLQRLGEQWRADQRSAGSLAASGFAVDLAALEPLLAQSAQAIQSAADTTALLTEEARLTKQLYRLAAQASRYGDFTRSQRGDSTDAANQFLDHGNYLALSLIHI